jgi:hypothetical protein
MGMNGLLKKLKIGGECRVWRVLFHQWIEIDGEWMMEGREVLSLPGPMSLIWHGEAMATCRITPWRGE